MPDLVHLRRTYETFLPLQHLFVGRDSSLDKIVIHQFPLIFGSTYHFTANIAMAIFPLLKKEQSRTNSVDNSFDFDLFERNPLF